jgi:hypothetical protein
MRVPVDSPIGRELKRLVDEGMKLQQLHREYGRLRQSVGSQQT